MNNAYTKWPINNFDRKNFEQNKGKMEVSKNRDEYRWSMFDSLDTTPKDIWFMVKEASKKIKLPDRALISDNDIKQIMSEKEMPEPHIVEAAIENWWNIEIGNKNYSWLWLIWLLIFLVVFNSCQKHPFTHRVDLLEWNTKWMVGSFKKDLLNDRYKHKKDTSDIRSSYESRVLKAIMADVPEDLDLMLRQDWKEIKNSKNYKTHINKKITKELWSDFTSIYETTVNNIADQYKEWIPYSKADSILRETIRPEAIKAARFIVDKYLKQ